MNRIPEALDALADELNRAHGLLPDGAGLDAVNRARVALAQAQAFAATVEQECLTAINAAAARIAELEAANATQAARIAQLEAAAQPA